MRETITGTGEDELAAMAIRLEERRVAKLAESSVVVERCSSMEQRNGPGPVEGRPLTADELERVLKRYPG